MAIPTLKAVGVNSNVWATSQGDSVVLPASAAGDAIVAILIGETDPNPFDLLHLSPNPAFTPSEADFNAAPSFSDDKGNTYQVAAINLAQAGADYTGTSFVRWNLGSYFPSIFFAYAMNVTVGTSKITVKSVYADGITRPQQLAAGKPIFDGGVNVVAANFSGIATVSAQDGFSSTTALTGQVSATNPAVAALFTPTVTGDIIITVGVMKSANAFSTQSGWTLLASGKCVGDEAHWAVAYLVLPQGSGTSAVAAISNVARTGTLATITANPNAFVAGQSVVVSGLTTVALNGTFVIVSANSTTFTYNTVASGTIASTPDTGTATIQQQGGFTNPLGYEMAVATLALKHS